MCQGEKRDADAEFSWAGKATWGDAESFPGGTPASPRGAGAVPCSPLRVLGKGGLCPTDTAPKGTGASLVCSAPVQGAGGSSGEGTFPAHTRYPVSGAILASVSTGRARPPEPGDGSPQQRQAENAQKRPAKPLGLKHLPAFQKKKAGTFSPGQGEIRSGQTQGDDHLSSGAWRVQAAPSRPLTSRSEASAFPHYFYF